MKKWRKDLDQQLALKGKSVSNVVGRALTDTELSTVYGGITVWTSFTRSNPDGTISFTRVSTDP